MSAEALQIVEKRREAKCKGEKERYTHLNTKFQRKGEIRKPSYVNKEKKYRATIEWKDKQSPQDN